MLLCLTLLLSAVPIGTSSSCSYDDSNLINWNTDAAWDSSIPSAGEYAIIRTGKHVRLNVSPPDLKGITIEKDASLVWGNYDKLVVTTDFIHVKGKFIVGDSDCPFTKKARIRLTGKSNTDNIVNKFGRKFIGVDENGTIELHGAVQKSWTKLIQTMPVGLETCGVVYNYQDSIQKKETTRGLYAMVFNADGSIFDFGIFKTYDANDDTAEDNFKYFIENIPTDKILVVAVNGDLGIGTATRDWEKIYKAIEAAGGLSSTVLRNVQGRDAYAFIMKTGDTTTAKEQHVVNPYDDTTISTERLVYYDEIHKLQYSVVGNVHPNYNNRLDIRVLALDVAYPKLKLNDDVTSWVKDDTVIVTSTDYDWKQVEEFKLVDCSDCDVNEVRVDHPFEYMHYGEITQGIDERSEVALLTRSILIEGVMEDECYVYDAKDQELCDKFKKDMHGGHVKIIRGFVAAHIENVELYHMGQHKFLGSYGLHFHMCDDVDGNWFRNNAIHHSLSRAITVHGSDGAEVKDNVVYLTYGHSIFLEDCVEQRNIIDGNLALGTDFGIILLSDMKREWCNDTWRQYCNALSTFWLTHPNNYVRNNVGAGGEGTGFWYITSYGPLGPSKERQLERMTAPPYHAYHSKILEFDNNAAHSYSGRGMRIDQRLSTGENDTSNNNFFVPENGFFNAVTSHEPRDPPTPEGTLTVSHIKRFRAYKNRHQNIWTKAGNLIMDQFSSADASRGLSMGKGGDDVYTEATRCLFIGETDNTGYPEEPFGRSQPNKPDEAIQGVEFYMGPGYITNSFFDKYTHLYAGEVFRPSAAIGHKRNTPYPPQPASGVSGIKFGYCDTPDTNWVFLGAPPLRGFGNQDGNRASNIHDYDGSVTGTAGTQLVPLHRFYTTNRCLTMDSWHMAICPYQYCRAKFKGSGGAFQTNFRDYAMDLRRDDRPNDRFSLSGERGNNYLLIKNMSYIAHFNGTSPHKLPIHGINLLPGDYIRFGLCYPSDSEFKIAGNAINNTHKAFPVDNIGDLDSDKTGRAYFWDQPRGLLFVKVFGISERVHKERCPGFYCPRIIVNRLSGSDERADCYDAAYGDGTYTKPEDTSTPIPSPPECITSTKPEDWGAPAIPSQYTAEPFSLTCPQQPEYPEAELIGCYKDVASDRDLNDDRMDLYNSMTVKFCTDRCYQRNYAYAALQNGNRCFCGNRYGGHGEAPGECTKPCAGDNTQTCGDFNRNEIYATGREISIAEQQVCGPNNGGVIIENKCYYLTPDAVEYTEGQRACVKLGGNLATITSQAVQDEVQRYMQPKMVDAWFGLNDIRVEGTKEYADGTPFGSYDNTKEGQGDGDYEDGYTVQTSFLYAWNDRAVTVEFQALCEIPLDAVAPSGESCGTNGAGMKFASGSCYAVVNTEMSKTQAEYACRTRMGSIVDISDQNRAEILKHVYVYGETMDYWTKQVDSAGTYYEMDFKQLYDEVATTKFKKNAVICSLEDLSASNPCSEGWKQLNDKCYLYTDLYTSSYQEALDLCQVGSSNLVSIHSKEENDFVSQIIKDIRNTNVWIGFEYKSATYEWVDGSEASYLNWRKGHGDTNIGAGKCARIRSRDGVWQNRDCTLAGIVMCQAPAGQ